MTKQVNYKCDIHESPFDCPDALISYSEKSDEYGLIIYDGGHSVLTISYCPFCGAKLPESKRDLWFETLESMGIDPTKEDKIPENFKTSAWRK